MMNKNNDKFQIRNSTDEFLIFTSQAGENSIEVMVVISPMGNFCIKGLFYSRLYY